MDQGIYVHPFWCFQKNVGNYWGFDTSATPSLGQSVDLPNSMRTPLQPMTSAVHSHIMKTGTFDSKSEYAKIIKSCPSDGYRALKLIIMRSHPNFIEEPAQYLTDYPQQKKDETVFDFTQVFSDYLQLQSFVLDNNRGIGDKSIQESFSPAVTTSSGSSSIRMMNVRANPAYTQLNSSSTRSCNIHCFG